VADDEVYMFNALWLNGDEGRRMYAEYGRRSLQLVESLGGGIDYVLSPVDTVDDDFMPMCSRVITIFVRPSTSWSATVISVVVGWLGGCSGRIRFRCTV